MGWRVKSLSRDMSKNYQCAQPLEGDADSSVSGATALFKGHDTQKVTPGEQPCRGESTVNASAPQCTYASCVSVIGTSKVSKAPKPKQRVVAQREGAVRDKVNNWLPGSFDIAENYYTQNPFKDSAIYYYCKALSRVSDHAKVCRLMEAFNSKGKVSFVAAQILYARSLMRLGRFSEAQSVIERAKRSEQPNRLRYYHDASGLECQIISFRGQFDEAKTKLKRAITLCESSNSKEKCSLLRLLESIVRDQLKLSYDRAVIKDYEYVSEQLKRTLPETDRWHEILPLKQFDFYIDQSVVDFKKVKDLIEEAKKVHKKRAYRDSIERWYFEFHLTACEIKLRWRESGLHSVIEEGIENLKEVRDMLRLSIDQNHPFVSKQLDFLESFSSELCSQSLYVGDTGTALSAMKIFIDFKNKYFPQFKMSNHCLVCFSGVMLKKGNLNVAKELFSESHTESIMISAYRCYVDLHFQVKNSLILPELEKALVKLTLENPGCYQVRDVEVQQWLLKTIIAFKNRDENRENIIEQAESVANKHMKDFNQPSCYTLRGHLAFLRGDTQKARELHEKAAEMKRRKALCHNPPYEWYEITWEPVIQEVLSEQNKSEKGGASL